MNFSLSYRYIPKIKLFQNVTFWFLTLGLLQGVFYGYLYPLVNGRLLPIFSLTPFNLFPTDLFVFPLAIVFAILSLKINKGFLSISVGRHALILFWLFVMFQGLLVGYLNENEFLIGDFKNIAIRSLFAPLAYLIGRFIDLPQVINRFLKLSVVLALFIIFQNVMRFLGADIHNNYPYVYKATIWPEISMLFPYSILFTRYLYGHKFTIQGKAELALIALSSFSDLWKPNVASFVLCTFLCIITVWKVKGLKIKVVWKGIRLFLISVVIILLLISLLSLWDQIINLFNTTYLKSENVVRDLSGGRFQIISLGLEKWKESPVIGVGFGEAISGYFFDAGTGRYIILDRVYPHNFALQILYQLGIIGALLVTMMLFVLIRKNHQEMKFVAQYEKAEYIGIFSFCNMVVLVSLFSETIPSEVSGYFYWIGMGLLSTILFRSKLAFLLKGK